MLYRAKVTVRASYSTYKYILLAERRISEY